MFSYHPNTEDLAIHRLYTKGFKVFDCSPEKMADYIKKYVNSACVWRDGFRRQHNWIGADWAVFDVDDGLEIGETLHKVRNHIHILGTTKSNQIWKGDQPPRDRYRIWLKLEKICKNLDNYKHTQRRLGERFGSDLAAVDGARKYLPCKEIVSVKPTGLPIKILTSPPVVKPRLNTELPEKYIPSFIKEFLNGNVYGSRNLACYKCGIYLTKNGWNVDEIVDMIMRSSLTVRHCSRSEVYQAVSSGASRA